MDLNAVYPTSTPKVRVLIFGHKDFSQLMSRAIGDYQNSAEFMLYDAIVGSASEVRPLIRKFEPHVIVSAGANATYLRSVLDIPVISLFISEQDWLNAVTRAAKVSNKVDIICFEHSSPVLPIIGKELGTEVRQHVYHTSDQAREIFHTLRRSDTEAIIGASLVCGLASQFNLPSFLVYSMASCKQALEHAIAKGQRWANQLASQTLTHWLLNQSKTPIIVTDKDGQSYQMNKAAKQELGIRNDQDFDIQLLLSSHSLARSSLDGECEINGQDWFFHRDQVDMFERHRYVFQLYKKRFVQQAAKPRAPNLNAVFDSPQMKEVIAQVKAFAPSPGNILLYGESGTGKEVVARAIHQHGSYAQGQFVAVNCGAIPSELFEGELFGYQDGAFTGSKRGGRKGLIESARGGVLFLDEVSELHLLQQTKLLRVIQERRYRPLGANEEIDIELKLVAASNRKLSDMVASGEFREDLYYRLNVFNIQIPPLRERPDDIHGISIKHLNLLANRYEAKINAEAIFDAIEEQALTYNWPGNIRELENALERIVAWLNANGDMQRLSQVLKHIIPEFSQSNAPTPNSDVSLIKQQERLILHAMKEWNGDKRKVAAQLGISSTTLWRRLKKLNDKN